jgi:hypothetical protein
MSRPASLDALPQDDTHAASAHQADASHVRQRLIAYLQQLGLRDPVRIASFADECLRHAARKVAPGSHEELIRRALEEAQRRFEHAVARAMGLTVGGDFHPVAAARAALLLRGAGELNVDDLLSGDDDSTLAARLRAVLPRPTPPEAGLSMHEQPISFLISRSPKPRH